LGILVAAYQAANIQEAFLMAKIALQVSIAGYAGKPTTLLAGYNDDADILLIAKELPFQNDRREGSLVITNNQKIERDLLFTDDDFQESIYAFFSMRDGVGKDGKSQRLTFHDSAARSNPSSIIEKDGIDSNGQKYRISDTITCAQVATLAACIYANAKATDVRNALDMADTLLNLNTSTSMYELDKFLAGDGFTI
jgi:hypothetical protein